MKKKFKVDYKDIFEKKIFLFFCDRVLVSLVVLIRFIRMDWRELVFRVFIRLFRFVGEFWFRVSFKRGKMKR